MNRDDRFSTEELGALLERGRVIPPVPDVVRARALARAAAEGTGVVRNVQVVADKDNNTLLVVATPGEFAVVEAAVRKLDVLARQVMMEVTIANVTLTDEFNFGVDWLFRGGAPSGRGSGGLVLGAGSTAGNPNPGTPGTGPRIA